MRFNSISTIFIVGLICLTSVSCTEKKADNSQLHFHGTLEGYGDGIINIQFYGPKEVTKDSIVVLNDKFDYIRVLASPRQAFILIEPNENLRLDKKYHRIDYLMENSEINLRLKINDLDNHVITGSTTEDEYQTIRNEVQVFSQNYVNARDLFNKAEIEVKDSLKEIYDRERDTYLTSLMKNTLFTTSAAGPYILWLSSRYLPTEELETVLKAFDPTLSDNIYFMYMKNKVDGANRVKIGNLAPNFALKDLNGETYTLESFKGNYLLMDFEASWCKPCKLEIPFLKTSYEQYTEKGLTIISVNLDVSRELWEKDQTTENLPWKMLSDLTAFNGKLTKDYGITAIPRIFLLDPNGKIVANNLRGEMILKKLKEVYSE